MVENKQCPPTHPPPKKIHVWGGGPWGNKVGQGLNGVSTMLNKAWAYRLGTGCTETAPPKTMSTTTTPPHPTALTSPWVRTRSNGHGCSVLFCHQQGVKARGCWAVSTWVQAITRQAWAGNGLTGTQGTNKVCPPTQNKQNGVRFSQGSVPLTITAL